MTKAHGKNTVASARHARNARYSQYLTRRAEAIRLFEAGHTKADIARRMGTYWRTVHRWITEPKR